MDNVTFITNERGEEYVIIDRGNNEFTSMSKAYYDAQLEEQANDQSL